MEKVIIFSEKEFNELLLNFAEELLKYSKQGYGYSLISNESGKKLESSDEICGALLLPWNNVFKEKD